MPSFVHTTRDMQRDMKKREMEITHFAHDHPLIFNESKEIPFCCNACGLRVLSSPSYICPVQGCSFYLHEPCTQLPDRLTLESSYRHTHVMRLHAKPPHEDCSCSRCGNLCKNFTYHCDGCGTFDLDPFCVHPLNILINHVSHKEHPMAAICKESLMLCVVCGRKHSGFSFSCLKCNYWIHQDCASLPSNLRVGRHHRHHLSLLYSGSIQAIYFYNPKCLVCKEYISKFFGAYACIPCVYLAHVHCALSAMENPGKTLHLPAPDDSLLSLIMHKKLEENAILESNGEAMLEKYHAAHSLILNNETAHESVCNACIRQITPPYYSCSQSACDFLLHKFCADLPSVVNSWLSGHPSRLHFPRCDGFFSLFFCGLCQRFGNGFAYYDGDDSFHLECALAPTVIKHDSHKLHPLIKGGDSWLEDVVSCCGEINPSYYDLYSCTQCRFCVHIRCALLPKTVTHKFDKHPLTLVTDCPAQNLGDDHICEFCEEDINPSHWFYRCIECDNSFHVKCIPSTGRCSKIKFGGTVVLPSCHGDHPLTLVRMQGVGSQNCGFCHKTIEGFKDGMALHCAKCDFWIHFRCGWKSSGATVLEPYGDISYLSDLAE